MTKFAAYLREIGIMATDSSVERVRQLADQHPKESLSFRSTTARDFLAEMRRCARTIKSSALVNCNNSLNAPNVLFSQARACRYNIQEMSKTENLRRTDANRGHEPGWGRLVPRLEFRLQAVRTG